MDTLSPLAHRALETIKSTHTSVGHMALPLNFDEEVRAQFVPLMDELAAAGYLTRTVYLVDRSRRGSFGEDDYEHVALSDEESVEAIACQRDKTPFVNPDTGDERVPGPEDLFISYCTTSQVPVLPPPLDPLAVELHARLLKEYEQHRAMVARDGLRELNEARIEGRAEAFREAASIVARIFGLPTQPAAAAP